ncbi:MAG: YeeE/YedE family protein [Beijerinckiaceae bacterium]
MLTQFAPLPALAGGVLIGLAAVILMAGIGRIAGVCGILLTMMTSRDAGAISWRLAFVLGMPLGALLVVALGWKDISALVFPADLLATAFAGILVGVGTTLGSGCTSGHGVCGLARFSIRSIAATMTFMATGIATVFIVRHIV